MMIGGTKHRAFALALFLLAALIALASGLAGPTGASAKTPGIPQNRVWKNSARMLQSRPIQTLQTLDLQRGKSLSRYDSALGDTLAVKDIGAAGEKSQGLLGKAGEAIGKLLGKTEGAGAATGPIRAGEVTTFQNFVDRSVVGDNLEGHELWQHANLRAKGLATERLLTAASQDNPVIALDRALHRRVNAAQGAVDAATQTPAENIKANAAILRKLNAADRSTIARLRQMAIRHARKNGY